MTVNGNNFGSKAVVNWNGAAQSSNTTVINGKQLSVNIPAAMIATPGTARSPYQSRHYGHRPLWWWRNLGGDLEPYGLPHQLIRNVASSSGIHQLPLFRLRVGIDLLGRSDCCAVLDILACDACQYMFERP